jgi:uncharacterized phage-associated protein
MVAWSVEVANEFIRRANAEGRALTQMQLQKLVYIAHAWNLAINGSPLTQDNPQAWDYGPVYVDLRDALRKYGSDTVSREISYDDTRYGRYLTENPDDNAMASDKATARLSEGETSVIERVFRDYGKFHAYKLSALTHQEGSPWENVYANGEGKNLEIKPDLIKEYFIDLATRQSA